MTRTKEEMDRDLADYEYWKQVMRVLGPGWKLIGFTYRTIADVSTPNGRTQSLGGELADALLRIGT